MAATSHPLATIAGIEMLQQGGNAVDSAVAAAMTAVVYATMGGFAVLFIGAVFPLAWEIALRPNQQVDRSRVQAIVAGLLMTGLVGGGTGAA